jgi:CBS domain-containing protein
MLRLRDIMTANVVTLSPEQTLREAMDVLVGRHVTGAPVVSHGRVVGVLSATDILEFQSAAPGVPTQRPEQAEWGAFEEEGETEEIDDESSAGFYVDLWDDAGAPATERFEATSAPEWDVLAEHTVDEAMTQVVFSLPPDATVPAAAEYMREAQVHRILVMQGDGLLGLVTTTDITAAVADQRLVAKRYVFDRRGDDRDYSSEF